LVFPNKNAENVQQAVTVAHFQNFLHFYHIQLLYSLIEKVELQFYPRTTVQ